MEVTHALPCLKGRSHNWRGDPCAWARCATCSAYRADTKWRCGWSCDLRDTKYTRRLWDERLQEWVVVESQGTCGACMEEHDRKDDRHYRNNEWWHGFRAAQERRAAEAARREERDEQWRLASEARTERRRQRRRLAEGRRTLQAIRRHLRAPASSPLRESRPERTSPTS